MRKLWAGLLSVLLVASLLATGALAEGELVVIEDGSDIAAEDDGLVVAQAEEDVYEASGLLADTVEFGEATAPEALEDGANGAMAQLDPEPPRKALAESGEFEIINGILVKYNGPGGDVVIPDGVTAIGKEAFKFCGEMTSVVIPNSVTSIGENAFMHCTKLGNVTLPRSVASLGQFAFYGCESFTEITIPNSIVHFDSGVFCRCNSLRTVTVCEGITSFGAGTFMNCGSLASVKLPQSLTWIGFNAFQDCSALREIDIPENVETIAGDAFSGCTMLNNVVIPSKVTQIGDHAFENCYNLTRITIESDNDIVFYDNAFNGIPSTAVFHTHCETPATKWALDNGYAVVQSPHRAVADPAVAATCTEAGRTAGAHCSVCGEVLTAQETVPAKGHTEVADPAVAATCTKAGKTAGVHCSVCGEVLEPRQKVPALGHAKVTDKAVAATYSKTGLTKGSHCSVCGKVLKAQKKVAKLKVPKNGILLAKNLKKSVKAGAKRQIVLNEKAKSYRSENAAVATVGKQGLVTAKLAGTARIAVALKGGKTLTLTLKVTDANAAKKLTFAQGKRATLKKGRKLALEVKSTPEKANYALTWTTDNAAVATVTKKGVVRAKGPGTAKITATTQNGVKATITITVK